MLIIGLCLCWCSCVIETKTSSFWWLRKETTWSEIPRLSLFGRQFCKNYDIYLYLQMTTVNTNCKGRTLHHHKCSNFPRINSCLSLETKKGGLWIITWVQNFKWIILCIIRKKGGLWTITCVQNRAGGVPWIRGRGVHCSSIILLEFCTEGKIIQLDGLALKSRKAQYSD